MPVPTAGAEAGMLICPATPAAEPTTDSEANSPWPRKVVAVPLPTARQVITPVDFQDTLVFAVVLRAIAPPLTITVEPSRKSRVSVPGVVTMLLMRPEAVHRSALPVVKKNGLKVHLPVAWRIDVAVVVLARAEPSCCIAWTASTHALKLMALLAGAEEAGRSNHSHDV